MNKKSIPKKLLIFGRRPVQEAIDSGRSIDKIFVQKGVKGEIIGNITAKAREARIPVKYVPPEKINRLVNGNHQGIVGILSPITYYKAEDVLSHIYERQEDPLFLVLDGVTDIRNLGALARTAECFGVHALLIATQGIAPINADAIKVSAGALTKIPVCREASMNSILDFLNGNGLQIIAADLEGDTSPEKIDLKLPTALLLGAEGEGIRESHLSRVTHRVKIPMTGSINSLNVSVAGGILMFEAMRQRQG